MYRATVENSGGATYDATTRHASFTIATDGGGANPIDTMLAGLCACIGHQIRDFFDATGMPESSFEVRAEAGLSKDLSRLADIQVHIDLNGMPFDTRNTPELLLAAERCKIHRALREGVSITITVSGSCPATS